MSLDEVEEKGFELTKDLDKEVFHVQVVGPCFLQDNLEILFLDGCLKGATMKVNCYNIEK